MVPAYSRSFEVAMVHEYTPIHHTHGHGFLIEWIITHSDSENICPLLLKITSGVTLFSQTSSLFYMKQSINYIFAMKGTKPKSAFTQFLLMLS